MDSVLLVPGYGNSGPAHWQSHWQSRLPKAVRAELGDWDHPDEASWLARLKLELPPADDKVVLVAHSLGCLLVVNLLAACAPTRVAGAFLVAPPDPAHAAFPSQISGFRDFITTRLSVPSLVVSSTNDPYSPPGFGPHCATLWGSRHVSIGAAGHINAASGHGPWEEGLELLHSFLASLRTH